MIRFHSISQFLAYRHLPKAEHPLICVFEVSEVERLTVSEPISWAYDFYAIGLKQVSNAREVRLKYGQQEYDYNEGILSFVAPGQVMRFSFEDAARLIRQSGWMLLIHPDLLWNTPLAQKIRQYDFWDYSVNEALFLSEREEATLIILLKSIQQECGANIDRFSKGIIVAHLEALLNYADRYYHRQFLTREKANHRVLERLERILTDHFADGPKRLLTVADVAASLNISAKYLSSLLKTPTGLNTQQHIHEQVIKVAKEKLSTTELTVSEIAHELGFEHLQSFSKLFKTKTSVSPLAFRASFN